MSEDPKNKTLATGRLGRLASMARAGLGTATSLVSGSGDGLTAAVDRLGELRGLGTKVGQMAGLAEASMPAELRDKLGPALAKLRAQAVRSPSEQVVALLERELGAPIDELFESFEREPFASASLGQVHGAVHPDGRRLAVKVQHPGIERAFAGDLQNVGMIARVATSFVMPSGQGASFVEGVKRTFLRELDYGQEAENMLAFERLVAGDPELELPSFVPERSSARVLSATFLEGETVEVARAFDPETKRRQAAAVRRLVLSALADHGLLYADAHAGNFFFRPDGTVGVLDFGSVVALGPERAEAFGALFEILAREDRAAVPAAVDRALGFEDRRVAEAIGAILGLSIGGLVRGEAIGPERIREITGAVASMKKRLPLKRVRLPFFMPFLMRTTLAANALLAALDAPPSGPLTRLAAATRGGSEQASTREPGPERRDL